MIMASSYIGWYADDEKLKNWMMPVSKTVKITTEMIDDLMETGLIAGCFSRPVLQYFDSHSVSLAVSHHPNHIMLGLNSDFVSFSSTSGFYNWVWHAKCTWSSSPILWQPQCVARGLPITLHARSDCLNSDSDTKSTSMYLFLFISLFIYWK